LDPGIQQDAAKSLANNNVEAHIKIKRRCWEGGGMGRRDPSNEREKLNAAHSST
jgi:hypothetical protein